MYIKSNQFRKKNIVRNNNKIFKNAYHTEHEKFMYNDEVRDEFEFAYDRRKFDFDAYSLPVMIFKLSNRIRRICRF